MQPTPFQADCDRKSTALSQYGDRTAKRETCGTCGVIRRYHFESGCKFKRMNDREWADWCGIELQEPKPKADPYRRVVLRTASTFDVDGQGLAHHYYLYLDCGHRGRASFGGTYTTRKEAPKTWSCEACAREGRVNNNRQENGMNQRVNGKDHAGASVLAPTPAAATQQQPANTTQAHHTGNGGGFHKAVKSGAKARVALIGVPGGGKSLTMLILARALAGPDGKIAAVDTEHGSLSKYAHTPACGPTCANPTHFAFDVAEPDSYRTEYLLEQLTYAEEHGYAVFCCDSYSHFWMGKDGALEYVDNLNRRSRDKFEGWNQFSSIERQLVTRIVASPCHVVMTMRTKNEYQDQIGPDGKKKRVKIGMAPVQRDGQEYEFDLVCMMDEDSNLIVDKTRCSAYKDDRLRVQARPTAKYFQPLIEWLGGPIVERAPQPSFAGAGAPPPPVIAVATAPADPGKPWSTFGEMKHLFLALRETIGEYDFLTALEAYGWKSIGDIKSPDKAIACYRDLQFLAERAEEARQEVK